MTTDSYAEIFNSATLDRLFPPERADQFFDALFGDASEGAYNIRLGFVGHDPKRDTLQFELQLLQRPGKCLACNLTYGLPEVFSRHPIINIKGLTKEIDAILAGRKTCAEWRLGATRSVSKELYSIPLEIKLQGPAV